MLILTRKPGQSLLVHPHPALDPETPVERLFAEGPIHVQVVKVQGSRVCLGVTAHAGFSILRNELRPWVVNPLTEGARRVVARKLKVLMVLNRHSIGSLAHAAGLVPAQVLAATTGEGMPVLDDLERIAQALGVKVGELFLPPGRTAVERLILAILEGAE